MYPFFFLNWHIVLIINRSVQQEGKGESNYRQNTILELISNSLLLCIILSHDRNPIQCLEIFSGLCVEERGGGGDDYFSGTITYFH